MGRKPKSEDARLITLAEGKTKIVRIIRGTNRVLIESKDDLTAGDGAKRATIPEKGILATTTTCNCFRLLRRESVPTHYIGKKGPRAFVANRAKMFPIEMVARKIATGSYLRRNPGVSEGKILNPLVWEFFLKDDARHDSLMLWNEERSCFAIYDPKKPIGESSFLGYIRSSDNLDLPSSQEVNELGGLLFKVFCVLETAWRELKVTLVDLKIECGRDAYGNIVVADVIDNDSWRIWPNGDKSQMKDKQVFRDNQNPDPAALAQIKENYEWVARATDKFLRD